MFFFVTECNGVTGQGKTASSWEHATNSTGRPRLAFCSFGPQCVSPIWRLPQSSDGTSDFTQREFRRIGESAHSSRPRVPFTGLLRAYIRAARGFWPSLAGMYGVPAYDARDRHVTEIGRERVDDNTAEPLMGVCIGVIDRVSEFLQTPVSDRARVAGTSAVSLRLSSTCPRCDSELTRSLGRAGSAVDWFACAECQHVWSHGRVRNHG